MGMSFVGGTPIAIAPSAAAMGGASAFAMPALSHRVSDWIRAQSTQGERDNLALLARYLADFEAATGVVQPARPGSAGGGGLAGPTVTDGGDSLVISLGPRLRVGIRIFV